MRILNVSAFFESHGGGIEMVAGALARALSAEGHDCRLTGAGFDPAPPDAAVAAVPLHSPDPLERFIGLPMPLPSRTARAKLAAEVLETDAVVVHDALYASSVLAARFAQRWHKPWLLVQHIGAIPYSSATLRGALAVANLCVTRPMLSRAPQTVFISDAVRAHFTDIQFRRPPALMFNGVDSQRFHEPASGETARLKRQFGLSDQRPQLLFVGRFVERKGLAALRAFAALRNDCDLLMVGGGPIDPNAWALANVHVLGRRTRDELALLYRACDALVLPSVGEGYPLVVQEALASGMPVYCGRESASADPGAARFLHAIDVAPRDPALTARRLSDAIGAEIPLRSREAAVYAARTYQWQANARAIVAMLREVGA